MKALKALALATVPVVGAFLCVFLFQVCGAVQQIREDERGVAGQAVSLESQVDATVQHVQTTADAATVTLKSLGRASDSLNATIQTVNRPCGTEKPCGTLADVAKTLNTFRGTAGQVEIAAIHENRNLGTLDGQEATLFGDFHTTLQSTNALVANPAWTGAAVNLQLSAANIAEGTKQGVAIVTDARDEADKLVHPPKKKLTFWGAVMAAAGVMHKFEPPIF
jgi:hypothetical protein